MSTPDVTAPDATPPGVTPPYVAPPYVGTTKAVVNLRRAALIAACLGAVSFVVLAIAGHPLAAVFFCGGLGLGLVNTALVQRSAARFAASGDPNKRRFAVSVLGRLTLITGLAVCVALALRPEGLAVFAGLAALQLLMIFMASVPLLKELRRSGVGGLP
ncbi:MAG: ATP synthase subunit I [Pseudonocardiaceae bacterium]